MRTIAVSGAASGVGKTALIIEMTENLRDRVGIIKTSLGVQSTKRRVTADSGVIEKPGTDTARFREAGASQVVFVRTNQQHLSEDLEQARSLLTDLKYLIYEGNSLLEHVRPELIFYISRPGIDPKPSAHQAREKADIVIEGRPYFSGDKGESKAGIKLQFEAISCRQAQFAGDALGINYRVLGQMLNQAGIKVGSCQLGLF